MAFVSPLNSRGQSMDGLWLPSDGLGKIKLAIGTKAITGQATDGAWQGVATHTDGATFAANDGVVLLAGVDGTTLRKIKVDATGQIVTAPGAAGGNLTDKSGSITSGGTAQSLAATNTSRKYIFILNLHASEDLWFNFGTTAVADQPSIRLSAGQSFVMEGNFVSTQSISVLAATTGHKWTAKEG